MPIQIRFNQNRNIEILFVLYRNKLFVFLEIPIRPNYSYSFEALSCITMFLMKWKYNLGFSIRISFNGGPS
jgi:hypothetical protein